MLWPDEVRTPDFGFLGEDVEVRQQELAMAGSLIETLSGDFDAGQYKDSYREALQAVIEAKVEGREVVQPEGAQPTSGTVVDLMAALRASVEAAKKGRADSGDDAERAPPEAGTTTKPGGRKARVKAAKPAKVAKPPAKKKAAPAKQAARKASRKSA
jgi:DNA end-binding protein Ku